MPLAIGVDIGNVIIGGDTDDKALAIKKDLMFTDDYLKASEIPGAIGTVAWLNRRSPFRDRVFLVSKCGENTERKTREWLTARNFYNETAITEDKVRYVRMRPEKADVAKELGLTHFIDDRLEILMYLEGICTGGRYLFRGNAKEIKKFIGAFRTVEPVDTWGEIKSFLGGARAE